MKILIIFIGICALMACKTKQNIDETANQSNQTVNETEISDKEYPPLNIVANIGNMKVESTSVQILKSKIEGNQLLLKIGYSGGCAEHTFEFVGSEMISKSLPPIRNVLLVHNTDDSCRGYIERELIVDITALTYKQESGSQIKLHFQGSDEYLLYTYED